MRRSFLFALILVCRCAAPPAPVEPPRTPAPPPPSNVVEQDKVLRTVRVTASALNVRAEASTDADVVAQVKKGAELAVLRDGDGWLKVRLGDGAVGWVASRFVSGGEGARTATAGKAKARKSGGCPPDSDYAFLETPQLRGSDRSATGLVVVEANVNAKGIVTSTKILSNGTGDETLAFLAEREIKSAKFSPPIRNCVPRAFIFTYRRTF